MLADQVIMVINRFFFSYRNSKNEKKKDFVDDKKNVIKCSKKTVRQIGQCWYAFVCLFTVYLLAISSVIEMSIHSRTLENACEWFFFGLLMIV